MVVVIIRVATGELPGGKQLAAIRIAHGDDDIVQGIKSALPGGLVPRDQHMIVIK